MGRVKQNKKSTFIDMTAMSDVTVLLLTFFMLTSTFLAKEPYQPNTPPSVSTEEMPMNNVVQVLVNPEGKVWLTMNNDTAQEASNEKMRIELLENMSRIYTESTHKKAPEFTDQEKVAFSKLGAFGVPFKQLKEFLNASPEEQDQWIQGKLEDKGRTAGIPVTEKQDIDHLNEFQMWMQAMYRTSNDQLKSAIKDGTGVALKADQNTSFKTMHMVMDNLQTIKLNKFTLMTALKQETE